MNALVTGGACYIGSHTCPALLEAGHTVTVLDNLCNSSVSALARALRQRLNAASITLAMNNQ